MNKYFDILASAKEICWADELLAHLLLIRKSTNIFSKKLGGLLWKRKQNFVNFAEQKYQ